MEHLSKLWIGDNGFHDIDILWNAWYEALVCYGEEYGNCNVPWNLVSQLTYNEVDSIGHWRLVVQSESRIIGASEWNT